MAGTPNQVSSAGQFAFAQLPASLQGRQMDPFIYTCEIASATGNASSIASVSINNDADFLIISIVGIVTLLDSSAQITYIPATVLFTDNGSGRSISSAAVPWGNSVGTVVQPYYLDYPKYLARSTTISMQYNSLEATARYVRVALRGFKIFSASNQ